MDAEKAFESINAGKNVNKSISDVHAEAMEQDHNINDIGIDSGPVQPNAENKDEMSNSDDDSCSESDGTISEDSETEEPESKTKIFLTFIGCISLIAVFFTILGQCCLHHGVL